MDTWDSPTDLPLTRFRVSSGELSRPIQQLMVTVALQQRLDLVRHLAFNSERVPLLRGMHGVGKSSLIDLLQQQAPADWDTCRIDATPMLQPEQLLYRLCQAFSAPQGCTDSVERLIAHLTGVVQKGRLPVILVDDAEQLPVTSLELLFTLCSAGADPAKKPALILCATPDIDNLLEALNSRISSRQPQILELLPFDRVDSDHLVRHLLNTIVAQGRQFPPPSEAQYEKIFRASGGFPGEISSQVLKLVQNDSDAAGERQKKWMQIVPLFSDISPPVLVGAVVLALLLLLTLVYEEEINAIFNADLTHVPEEKNGAEKPIVVSPPAKMPADEAEVSIPAAHLKGSVATAPEPLLSRSAAADINVPQPTELEHGGDALLDVQPDLHTQFPAPEEAATALPEVESKLPEEEEVGEVVKQMPASTAVNVLPGAATAALPSKPKKVQELPRRAPEMQLPKTAPNTGRRAELSAPVVEPSRVSTPDLSAKIGATPVVQPPALVVPPRQHPAPVQTVQGVQNVAKQTSHAAPVSELSQNQQQVGKKVPETVAIRKRNEREKPAAVQDGGIRRESWLLQQSPEAYTLQLIAVGNEQAIAGFIQRHHIAREAAYFRAVIKGRPLFALLYGLYPNRSAALEARSQLPKSLADGGAWPRSLSSVQQAINGE
ncbi:MAG: AAA family ATPase [Gammaproteobacteria bacterium]|nr:AAA family ATPase [Gammaproteobacteria bacterium]